MRVALHVVAGSLGGPRTYGIALARALACRDDLELTVLTDRPEAFPGIRSVKLPRMRPLADHIVTPAVLQRLQPDVYHNTKNVLPFVAPCPAVVTVHDLAYHHFPETFSRAARIYLRAHTVHAVRRASRVVTVSQHARRDLIETLKVPEHKVAVAYNGVAKSFRDALPPQPLADLRRPYVLSVGTIQARKNLDVLVDAIELVRNRDGLDVELAIAGRRGWRTEAFDRAVKRTPVRLLGVVADADLPALYAHAAVFVQPSSYEGFGLTAAEAMVMGAPVVAANAGSLPEVVGDCALLVPPRDAKALAEALLRLLEDPQQARELGEAGRVRAQRFTWEASAEAHVAVYRAVAHRVAV
ncbi:MAG: glycosyltransferase family 4 protein [Planctomycetota bacterium]